MLARRGFVEAPVADRMPPTCGTTTVGTECALKRIARRALKRVWVQTVLADCLYLTKASASQPNFSSPTPELRDEPQAAGLSKDALQTASTYREDMQRSYLPFEPGVALCCCCARRLRSHVQATRISSPSFLAPLSKN